MSALIPKFRVAASAAFFGAFVLLASGSAHAAHLQQLTIYAVPKTAQFMNHADDRVRGMTNNPFNVNTKALIIITKGKEKGNGPFPGDDVLYSFDLYGGGDLKQKAGSAIFTCYYDFVKHATCDAYFELKGGEVLLASGPVVFNSTRFTLSVTGGTDKYLGAGGEVKSTPVPHNAQRFQFLFG